LLDLSARHTALRVDDGHDAVMVAEDIVFLDAELEVEDIEELTLDASNISLAEDTGAECPMYIL